jgi:hypothetical protein
MIYKNNKLNLIPIYNYDFYFLSFSRRIKDKLPEIFLNGKEAISA